MIDALVHGEEGLYWIIGLAHAMIAIQKWSVSRMKRFGLCCLNTRKAKFCRQKTRSLESHADLTTGEGGPPFHIDKRQFGYTKTRYRGLF